MKTLIVFVAIAVGATLSVKSVFALSCTGAPLGIPLEKKIADEYAGTFAVFVGEVTSVRHNVNRARTSDGQVLVASEETVPVREFVRRLYIHGLPILEAAAYGPAVVPELLDMLRNPQEKSHWPRIIGTLGLVGGEDVVPVLVAKLRSADGIRDGVDCGSRDVKISSLFALGYLASRTGSKKAISYLIYGLNPKIWSWQTRWKIACESYASGSPDDQLAVFSIIGLGLSGNSLAKWHLSQSLLTMPEELRDNVREAIETNAAVASKGLLGYYGEFRRNQEP